MKINRVIWHEQFVEKLQIKHQVSVQEVEQAVQNNRRIRRVRRGRIKGEDVYLALGQTDASRYLVAFFVYKKSHDAIVISVRDMDNGERDEYEEG